MHRFRTNIHSGNKGLHKIATSMSILVCMEVNLNGFCFLLASMFEFEFVFILRFGQNFIVVVYLYYLRNGERKKCGRSKWRKKQKR